MKAQHPINMSSAEYREKKFSKWGKSLPVGHVTAVVSMNYTDFSSGAQLIVQVLLGLGPHI